MAIEETEGVGTGDIDDLTEVTEAEEIEMLEQMVLSLFQGMITKTVSKVREMVKEE